jgi:hypothetical protein
LSTTSRRLAVAAVLVVLVALGWTGPADPAVASCAEVAKPSPHAFRGVVTRTRSDGRRATVRTDSGQTVEVLGGPRGGAFTSVDRTFSPGGYYEFHPVNASSPFEDNACTATRLITQGPVPAAAPFPKRTVALALLIAGGAAAALSVLRRSRSRSRT